MAQFGLENRFHLDIADLESLDQHRLGIVLVAHYADHFIEIQKSNQQSFEDMQAFIDSIEPPL